MRQKLHVTYHEINGQTYGISRAKARSMVKSGVAVWAEDGSLVELFRVRRVCSTRYVDDPTPWGESYKDEIMRQVLRTKQNKPRVADDYTPLPFGYGLEDAA